MPPIIEPIMRPARLFRYFSPGQSQIFVEQKLWFSTVSDFNDIFEAYPRHDQIIKETTEKALKKAYCFDHPEVEISYPDYKKFREPSLRKIIEESNEEAPEGFQARFSKYFGVVCFTEHLDSLLMWGHYADCHRGFVIEFNPQHNLFTPPYFQKVNYGQNRQVLTLTKKLDSGILFYKSSEWDYEDEHRLIKPKTDLSQGTYSRNGIQTAGHFIPLPMDSIKAVYFGCRISEEDRNNLLKPLEAFPSIERYFMRRNQIAYQLDVVPWKEWKDPTGVRNIILGIPLNRFAS
jgi:hypothetical protein